MQKWVGQITSLGSRPDGRLYLLGQGTGWYTQNADAGLARLDYVRGNK